MNVRSLFLGIVSLTSLLISPIATEAATITHQKMDATTELIVIDGDIVVSDVEQFRQLSLKYPQAIVALNSDGGLIHPAIALGKIIRVMGYMTVVGGGDVCVSACALIWMAGDNRFASDTGRIGFHASYRNQNGNPVESGTANALVGNYLTLLGASGKTIVFATTAPPDKVLWLTAGNKEASGIEYMKFPPSKLRVITPSQRPLSAPMPLPPSAPVRSILEPARAPAPGQAARPPMSVKGAPMHWVQIVGHNPATGMGYHAPSNWPWSDVPPEPWVLVSSTKAGSRFYINQETFKVYSETGWEFWTKLDASNDRTMKFRDKLNLTRMNCSERTIKNLSTVEHDRLGNVIYSWTDERHNPEPFEPIIPDTLGDEMYRAVCL